MKYIQISSSQLKPLDFDFERDLDFKKFLAKATLARYDRENYHGLKSEMKLSIDDYYLEITKMLYLISRTLMRGGWCKVTVENGDSKEGTVFQLDGDGTDKMRIEQVKTNINFY